MDDVQLNDYPKHPSGYVEAVAATDNGLGDRTNASGHYDATQDKRDMYRIGKKQELKRRFRYCACDMLEGQSCAALTSGRLNSWLHCSPREYLGVLHSH